MAGNSPLHFSGEEMVGQGWTGKTCDKIRMEKLTEGKTEGSKHLNPMGNAGGQKKCEYTGDCAHVQQCMSLHIPVLLPEHALAQDMNLQ